MGFKVSYEYLSGRLEPREAEIIPQIKLAQ